MVDEKKYVKILEDYVTLQQKADGITEKNNKLSDDLSRAKDEIQSLKYFTWAESPAKDDILDSDGKVLRTKYSCPRCSSEIKEKGRNHCGVCGQKLYRY